MPKSKPKNKTKSKKAQSKKDPRARLKATKQKDTTLSACGDCPAACCHDLTINIKKPRTNYDLECLMWQINYDTVAVYVRNRRWHLLVKGACQYLGDDHLCKIYEDRFDLCRDHKPPHCEWFDQWYDFMFTDPKELEAYIKTERKGKKPPMPKGKWLSKGAGKHKSGTKRR